MIPASSRAFHAMGTEVELQAWPNLPAATAVSVESLFEEIEGRLSRFRPDSELSQLNLSAGRPFLASEILRRVMSAALIAASRSGGLFDPTVLHAVRAAGYRDSIEVVQMSEQIQTPSQPRQHADAVRIATDGTITLPPGVGIDLGGIAKGWAVDEAAGLMPDAGAWLINAGGDLLVRGGGPNGDGWMIGVEDPFLLGTDIAVLSLKDCAVATSSTTRHRWKTQAGTAHHLIDPRTGLPSTSDLVSVTVLAESVAESEVTAKTLLLQGEREARRLTQETGVAALLVTNAGSVYASDTMEQHLVAS